MKERAVILARASSGKQIISGDTLDDQKLQCQEYIERVGWEKAKIFPLVESGSIEEREYFEEVLSYCENPKNQIKYIVFKNISRFTRQGGQMYLTIKNRMKKVGVELRDIYGTIGKEVNTMDKYGVEYSWSRYSPTEASEIKEAEEAKSYVRNSLTQMIGAEIAYVNKGYWNRRPPYGFHNKKTETADDRLRNILEEETSEAKYMQMMYRLREQGKLNDRKIVERINALGYKSRIFRARDRRTMKAIGIKGGKPLTVKQFQELIKRPIYAGVILEKWTHYTPVLAKFPGLVSIETFNAANRGKVKIVKEGEAVQVLYDVKLESLKRRSKHNPLFPFKDVVMCPICRKTLRGSTSTGKGGKKHPGYHCERNHKYWRVPRAQFHETVYDAMKEVPIK
ncbi:MAG: hypothetical protein DPW11_00290 [bacterium]|nr:hypothetical protein [Candidatus Microgenomates bacterium CPR3]MCQ3944208.1 hypothetical protein [bacterium]RIK51730.1 MAG: hypothetical protein DCC61_01475 [Candidatus Microgenomates bacterium]